MDNSNSIQQRIEIENIQEGVVILKDKSLRAVLMVSSINFSLKSLDEQQAIITRYQEFLNSLDFSLEIMIESKKYDLAEYILMLQQRSKEQKIELMKIQIAEYIDFIKNLSDMTNIMSKNFYVVVPFAAIEQAVQNFGDKILDLFKEKSSPETLKQNFQQQKTQLWQRVDYVVSGLGAIGLRAAPLNTEELIELFYQLYNPEAKEKPVLESQAKI